MSSHYLFPEPGSVPGIPGLFCGVRVDVADDGSFEVSPLPQHPHFEPAPAEEEAPKGKKKAKASEQKGGE
jgi:hypothetical protein